MILAVTTNQGGAIYSPNILTKYANFRNAFTWNTVSGDGNAENNSAYAYNGNQSVLITILTIGVGAQYRFNAGDGRLAFTANRTGKVKIAFSLLSLDDTATTVFSMGIYQKVGAGSYTPYDDIECTAHEDTFDYRVGEWNRFMADIDVTAGNSYDFDFNISSDVVGASVCFGGWKAEYVDRTQELPSIYNEVELKQFTETQTIDVPSISGGGSETVTMTVTGAKVGMRCEIIPPTELVTLGLVVSCPIVTDDDEVKFILHNHSGGSVNPASGSYTAIVNEIY